MSKKAENAVIAYFKDSYEELGKVTWPTKDRAIQIILIVVAFTIAMGIATGLFDFIFNLGYQSLLDLSQTLKQ